MRLLELDPLRDLSRARLNGYLDQGERGIYSVLQWLYFHLEKRVPLARAVSRRLIGKIGVSKWEIRQRATNGDGQAEALAKRQAQTLREAYGRLEQFSAALRFLALAELRGFSHLEKIYEADGKTITELRPSPQWEWLREGPTGAWERNRPVDIFATTGQPIEASRFIVHEIDDPAHEVLAFAHVDLERVDVSWDRFLSVYGIPSIIIGGPPNLTPEREAAFQQAAQKIGSDACGYVPNGTTLHVVEASPGQLNGAHHSDFWQRSMHLQKRAVAGVLTAADGLEGRHSGGLHADAVEKLAQTVANAIAGTLQQGFDREVLSRAFPGAPVLAYFDLRPCQPIPRSLHLDNAVKARKAGFQMDGEKLSALTGYRLAATNQ